MTGAVIGVADVADVRRLRSLVLRPGVPPEKLVYDGDDVPGALHVGAWVGGRLVGIASVCPEPMPATAMLPLVDGVRGWRLRGMATLPEVRGHGLGRELLLRLFAHVREHGGDVLWCNARVIALGFYRRLGFVTHGAEFDIPPIGPHYVMTKRLARVPPARVTLRLAQDGEGVQLEALARAALAAADADADDDEAAVIDPADLRGGMRFYTAADVDGELAAFRCLEPRAAGDVLLRSLFVHPRWWGAGLATQLVQHATGVAWKLGAAGLVVPVAPRLERFWRGQGALSPEGAEAADPGARRLPLHVIPC